MLLRMSYYSIKILLIIGGGIFLHARGGKDKGLNDFKNALERNCIPFIQGSIVLKIKRGNKINEA